MKDELRTMIDALRVAGVDLPEGFAAILDEWEFKRIYGSERFILVGCVSGDIRFPPGKLIFTSEVAQIDGRSSIRWVRTRNTLYRLGAPALPVPLIAAVALSDDWTDALTLTALATGEHTLSGAVLQQYTRLLDIEPLHRRWAHKRLLALASAMEEAGRFGLRAAWMLLGVDPRSQQSAESTRMLLAAPLDQASTDKAKRVMVAWESFADGDIGYLLDHRHDHIAAAHKVGRFVVEDQAYEQRERNEAKPMFVRWCSR